MGQQPNSVDPLDGFYKAEQTLADALTRSVSISAGRPVREAAIRLKVGETALYEALRGAA